MWNKVDVSVCPSGMAHQEHQNCYFLVAEIGTCAKSFPTPPFPTPRLPPSPFLLPSFLTSLLPFPFSTVILSVIVFLPLSPLCLSHLTSCLFVLCTELCSKKQLVIVLVVFIYCYVCLTLSRARWRGELQMCLCVWAYRNRGVWDDINSTAGGWLWRFLYIVTMFPMETVPKINATKINSDENFKC